MLNIHGQIIGINTVGISASEQGGFTGVGFAIPTNTVMRIVPVLIEKGSYAHPYIGINSTTLTSDGRDHKCRFTNKFQGCICRLN